MPEKAANNVNAKVKVKKDRVGGKRRAAGWTLLTLGVLVAALWFVSRWWRLGFEGPTWWVGSERGLLFVNRNELGTLPSPPRGLYALLLKPGRRGCNFLVPSDEIAAHIRNDPAATYSNLGIAAYSHDPGRSQDITLAFAPLPLLFWAAAAFLLRSDILARRRATKGVCPKCGYSLAGITEGSPCPECGKASLPQRHRDTEKRGT